MISDHMFQNLKNHKPSIIGLDSRKKSAVCIPIVQTQTGEYQILFEVRAQGMKHQPGDVCLPGGMLEPEETMREAAIRETCEELCMKPEQIKILGPMDILLTSTLTIYPFTAMLYGYNGSFSRAEVEETFLVPLSFFLEQEPDIYQIDLPVQLPENFPSERIAGGKNYQWRKRKEEICFYQYKDHTIWGLTASIIRSFVTLLKSKKESDL